MISGVAQKTTAEAARVLRACGVTSCQEMYDESVQHQEAAMQLMLGGKVLDEILDWIARLPADNKSGTEKGSINDECRRAVPIARSKL